MTKILTKVLAINKNNNKRATTKKQQEQNQEQNLETKRDISIDKAKKYVQKKMFEENTLQETTEEKDINQQILLDAMAGDPKAYHKVLEMITKILKEEKMSVKDYSEMDAVKEIYSQTWGLDVVEKYNRDPEVDEIRVNGPNNIYIVRKGKSERVKDKFKSPSNVEQVIKRMIIEDVGVSLDRSSPRVESVRKDGSRLTATCYPVTKTWTFVLRKHGTFEMTLDNLIKAKTLDKKTWEVLSVLVKGRANILFSGNVGAGKTSMMRKVVELADKALRLLVIGKDLELKLSEQYPDRDIIEFEEHEYVGASMKALFETALRESPDSIIIEEFRGAGEAIEAIRACTRGHFGSMASAHFNNAQEAVEGTAMMMLEEGLTLPLELAKLRVARAFNIVVQMYGDAITGTKKIVGITEISVGDNNQIKFTPLVEWVPDGDEYMGEGSWIIRNQPSQKLLSHILKTVDREKIENVGWDTSCIKCGT